MTKQTSLWFILLAAIGASILTTIVMTPRSTSTTVSSESAYDRVMRTGTLRCGYFVWPPHFAVDPKTGVKSGVVYDIVEALGRTLNLKIEWTQEYVLGTQIEAMKSGKIDALCADGPWTRSAVPYLDYTQGYYFVTGYLYAAKNNKRIKDTNNLNQFNDPTFRITSIDGDGSEDYIRELFPNISRVSLPAISDPNLMIQNILAGKADIMWNDPLTIAALPQDQQDQLITLRLNDPIGYWPFVISLPKGNTDLIYTLNQGINILNNAGLLDKIKDKYNFPAHAILLPAPAYRKMDGAH